MLYVLVVVVGFLRRRRLVSVIVSRTYRNITCSNASRGGIYHNKTCTRDVRRVIDANRGSY